MFLSYIDAFGTTPGLLMNSKTKHRTNFGGSLALIMIILMLLCILFLGKELVYKEVLICFYRVTTMIQS